MTDSGDFKRRYVRHSFEDHKIFCTDEKIMRIKIYSTPYFAHVANNTINLLSYR